MRALGEHTTSFIKANIKRLSLSWRISKIRKENQNDFEVLREKMMLDAKIECIKINKNG